MESVTEWLKPQIIWMVIGFILILSEFAIPGLITSFFGIGALIVGVLCVFFNLSVNMQLLLFLSTSVVLLMFLRKRFKRVFMGKLEATDEDEKALEDILGQKAVVSREIKPNLAGKVEFRGTHWEAEATEPIAEGTAVEIVGQRNITLIVKPI